MDCKKLSYPSFIRVYLYRALGVNFNDFKTVLIGEDVYFDDNKPYLIMVGKWARITSWVKIFTHFFDAKHVPMKDQPFRFYDGEVVIGAYVFIGSNVVIAKPVKIGDGAVIGANAVITHDVPKGAIMVGSPARQVGERNIGEFSKW